MYFASLGQIQLLHIMFGFNFNFNFPSINIQFLAIIMCTIGILRFIDLIVRLYIRHLRMIKSRKDTKELTEIENKYMDFFVRLEYDMYDRNNDVRIIA